MNDFKARLIRRFGILCRHPGRIGSKLDQMRFCLCHLHVLSVCSQFQQTNFRFTIIQEIT